MVELSKDLVLLILINALLLLQSRLLNFLYSSYLISTHIYCLSDLTETPLADDFDRLIMLFYVSVRYEPPKPICFPDVIRRYKKSLLVIT